MHRRSFLNLAGVTAVAALATTPALAMISSGPTPIGQKPRPRAVTRSRTPMVGTTAKDCHIEWVKGPPEPVPGTPYWRFTQKPVMVCD